MSSVIFARTFALKGSEFKQLRNRIVPICVVVFDQKSQANQLGDELLGSETPMRQCKLVVPASSTDATLNKENIQQSQIESQSRALEKVQINKVKLLNPKLTKELNQKNMSRWLMPFGFIAGLTFTKMTGLTTFSDLGLSPWSEPVIGSLLGMGSGWIGSHVAAASVNLDENDDLSSLRRLNEEGKWLLLVETPLEIELPWQLVQETNPIDIVRISDS